MKVALLPMKAESVRIPDKNIKPLRGKPLFFHIINSIIETSLFDHVLINTDSPAIATLAKDHFGAYVKVKERPLSLRGNDIPMNSIIQDDIIAYPRDTIFVQLHATSPLLTASTLIDAMHVYKHHLHYGYDSLLSATEIKSRCFTDEYIPINHDPAILVKTQDLKPVIVENSGIYIFTQESFSLTGSRLGRKPFFYLVEPSNPEFIDIDCYSDWKLVESIQDSRAL